MFGAQDKRLAKLEAFIRAPTGASIGEIEAARTAWLKRGGSPLLLAECDRIAKGIMPRPETSAPARKRRVDVIACGSFPQDMVLNAIRQRLSSPTCWVRRQRLQGLCMHVDYVRPPRPDPIAPALFQCLPIGAYTPRKQFNQAFHNTLVDQMTHVILLTTKFDEGKRYARRCGKWFGSRGRKLSAIMIGEGDGSWLALMAELAGGTCHRLRDPRDIADMLPTLEAFVSA